MTFNEAEMLNAKELPNETEDNSVMKKVELKVEGEAFQQCLNQPRWRRKWATSSWEKYTRVTTIQLGQRWAKEGDKTQRYDYVYLVSYALNVAGDINNQEPQTYCEAKNW